MCRVRASVVKEQKGWVAFQMMPWREGVRTRLGWRRLLGRYVYKQNDLVLEQSLTGAVVILGLGLPTEK
jgi:hypothetical protein